MAKREMELLKRIEELEAKIKALEAAPKVEYHYHTHSTQYPQPYYHQLYPYNPLNPWCGSVGSSPAMVIGGSGHFI